MKRTFKLITWYIMLNKRLFRKKSFIAVLILLPFLAWGLSEVSKQESGILTVALVAAKYDAADNDIGALEDSKDLTEVIENIKESGSVIHFIDADSEEDAYNLILSHEVDAAWVFPASLKKAASSYLGKFKPVVKVIQKEEGTLYDLSKEIIYKNIFPYISYAAYRGYMYNIFGKTSKDKDFDNEIKAAYESINIKDNIVEFDYIGSESSPENQTDINQRGYLLSPLRGLMAVWLMLCGFAAAMYYKSDLQAGLFTWLDSDLQPVTGLAYIFSILINSGIMVLAAFAVSGVFTSLYAEIINMLMLIIAVSGFCSLVGILCKSIHQIAAIMPLSLIASIVLSPVFADIGVRRLQILTPLFYYLKAFYIKDYIYGFLIYILIIYILYFSAALISEKL